MTLKSLLESLICNGHQTKQIYQFEQKEHPNKAKKSNNVAPKRRTETTLYQNDKIKIHKIDLCDENNLFR